MPIYHFEHIIQLSQPQRLTLARTITDWHATTFKSPRFIVNVRFVDVSQGLLSDTYVGGEARRLNRLFVHLRSGTGRTQSQLQGMADKLEEFWKETVNDNSNDKQLRGVFILGDLDSAKESGFHLPMPGHFEQWVKDNTDVFGRLAREGDPDAKQVLEEIKTRPEFQK
ncbi:Fc.00g115570.m01.CDS01 [Cosmosporella sp. VM-42]